MTGKHSDTTVTSGTGKPADHIDRLIEMIEEWNEIGDPEGIDPDTLLEAFPEERSEDLIFEDIDQEEILARVTEEGIDDE
jgi:hypothetical protein